MLPCRANGSVFDTLGSILYAETREDGMAAFATSWRREIETSRAERFPRTACGKLNRNRALFVNMGRNKMAPAQGASPCATSPSQLIESTTGSVGVSSLAPLQAM
jgi:hypothetical protein